MSKQQWRIVDSCLEPRQRSGVARRRRVRLTVKLADMIDGVDLSAYHVGDELLLERPQAQLLIAEGWAAPVRATRHSTPSVRPSLAVAADSAALDKVAARLRPVVAVLQQQMKAHPYRRVEDRLRNELHEEQAKTIVPPPTSVRSRTTADKRRKRS